MLLLPAGPVIAGLALLVRATSRGPSIYRQTRVGKDNRDFVILKLRTMRHDAEDGTGPKWSPGRSDDRITLLGKWLRALHLDELPQLINVARGEMDFIGPRPERREIIDRKKLADRVENYMARHRVLPGITGLAQVSLPPDATIDCVRKKVCLDLEYLEKASLSLDLRIVLCTLLRVFGFRDGRAVELLGAGRQWDAALEQPLEASQVAAPEPARALVEFGGESAAADPQDASRPRRRRRTAAPRRPR
jgi:lipopolysaccharide/colanic/teichoic acid biosynthesis glycosyltransferase